MKQTITMTESEIKNFIKQEIQESMVDELGIFGRGAKMKDINNPDTQKLISQIESSFPRVRGSKQFQLIKAGRDFNMNKAMAELKIAGVDANSLTALFQSSLRANGQNFGGRKTAKTYRQIDGAEGEQVQTPDTEAAISKGGNPQVAKLQQALLQGGYQIGNSGPQKNGVDGLAGPKTIAAIKQAMADGKIDLSQHNALIQQLLKGKSASNQQAMQQHIKALQDAGYQVTPPQQNQGWVNNGAIAQAANNAIKTPQLGVQQPTFKGLTQVSESEIRNEIRKTIKEMLNK